MICEPIEVAHTILILSLTYQSFRYRKSDDLDQYAIADTFFQKVLTGQERSMLLDPVYLFENWDKILSLVIVIAVFKGSIFSMLAMLFRYINIVPIAVGLGLFQVGEFAFVLARLGLETQAIDQSMYSLAVNLSLQKSKDVNTKIIRLSIDSCVLVRRQNLCPQKTSGRGHGQVITDTFRQITIALVNCVLP